MKTLTSNRGNVLLVVVIMAILGGVILSGIIPNLTNAYRSTAQSDAVSELRDTMQTVRTVLGESASPACATALRNSETPPTTARFNPDGTLPASALVDSVVLNGNVFIGVGQSFGGFQISSIGLTEIDVSRRIVAGPTTQYLTLFTVGAVETTSPLRRPTFKREFKLWVIANNSAAPAGTEGIIQQCYVAPNNP